MGINLLDWRRRKQDSCKAAGAGSKAKVEVEGGRFFLGGGIANLEGVACLLICTWDPGLLDHATYVRVDRYGYDSDTE